MNRALPVALLSPPRFLLLLVAHSSHLADATKQIRACNARAYTSKLHIYAHPPSSVTWAGNYASAEITNQK